VTTDGFGMNLPGGRWGRLLDQLAGLIGEVRDPLARRATAVALLHHKIPGVSWTGFYMLREGRLVVDVYQGPLACLVLRPHRGVCWAAIDQAGPVIVPDVSVFEGHVPCDERTRSEIVLPFRDGKGTIIGVLDVDSRHLGHFTEEHAAGYAAVLRLLEETR